MKTLPYKNNIKKFLDGKFMLALAAILLSNLTAVAQYSFASLTNDVSLTYKLHGWDARPVKKEKLNDAKLVSDIVPGYPVNWISKYVSVEILATCNGKAMKAVAVNKVLSAEQKKLLKDVDLGTDIVVNVNYRDQNPVTYDSVKNTMHTELTIIPTVEAEFVGGYGEMSKYLRDNGINTNSNVIAKQLVQGRVKFTVNEDGKVSNAKISRTSGSTKVDRLLLDAVNKMPYWKPAENSKGEKVKQEFELTMTRGGDGC